ncbi:hypothetical protein AVEN_166335-1 [Araneus ventricosus]|uniref:Uncharacterized protein n=1 Tax=Araneus ventricosus TaxID=182803 RepID=A0A4Y2TCH8_ARAVE|nr:hypothetical protein AVEN_166335-1 [Araneus ventricosus]
MKRKIIEKRDRGLSEADICRSTSRICTIFKSKDITKESCFKGSYKNIYGSFLTMLKGCFSVHCIRGDNFSKNIICEKVKVIFVGTVKKTPGPSMTEEVFQESIGFMQDHRKRMLGFCNLIKN